MRAEAVLIAVPATALAFLPSARLGHWLLDRFADSGVVSPALRYEQSWIPTVSGAAIALFTAVGAAVIAARGATRVRPVEALAEASLQRRWLSPLRLLFALLCLTGGLALALITALALAGPVAASTAGPAAMLWAAELALLGRGIARRSRPRSPGRYGRSPGSPASSRCSTPAPIESVATAGRRREFALQRLIGSTRPQILRMMTIEGLFVATAGTALGTLIAVATLIPFNVAAAVPA